MGLWLELIVLALCAYITGIGVGWLLWARSGAPANDAEEQVGVSDVRTG